MRNSTSNLLGILHFNEMIGIYKITSPTKKVYIGQSTNIEKRFSNYKGLHCKAQPIIYNSFLKHGFEKHTFEILCECEIFELNDKERYYQDLYSAIGINGLNCKLTETKDRSGKLSKETRRKIGLSHIGKKKKPESIEKQRISMKKTYDNGYINPKKGVKMSTESRKKMSDSGKLKKLSANHKEKIRLTLVGHKRLVGRTLSKTHKENCRLNATKYKSKIVLDTQNGIFYESAKELSDITKIPHSTLRGKLNGSNANNTNYLYV